MRYFFGYDLRLGPRLLKLSTNSGSASWKDLKDLAASQGRGKRKECEVMHYLRVKLTFARWTKRRRLQNKADPSPLSMQSAPHPVVIATLPRHFCRQSPSG